MIQHYNSQGFYASFSQGSQTLLHSSEVDHVVYFESCADARAPKAGQQNIIMHKWAGPT